MTAGRRDSGTTGLRDCPTKHPAALTRCLPKKTPRPFHFAGRFLILWVGFYLPTRFWDCETAGPQDHETTRQRDFGTTRQLRPNTLPPPKKNALPLPLCGSVSCFVGRFLPTHTLLGLRTARLRTSGPRDYETTGQRDDETAAPKHAVSPPKKKLLAPHTMWVIFLFCE